MRSKKLRNLVASVALIAMAVTVVPATHANAAGVTTDVDISKDQGFFENNWSLNGLEVVDAYDKSNSNGKLSSSATETKENVISIEKVETGVIGKKTIVGSNKVSYEADDRQGGFVRLGLRITGNLESYLRSYINDAVNEYRNNVNLINSNQHNGGNAISTSRQDALGMKLYDAFLGLRASDGTSFKNSNLEFLVTYEQDGRTRTTNVSAKDIRFEVPRRASSVETLNSLVDENGLVYLTLRGLPTGINITNIELDSRADLYFGTSFVNNNDFTSYSVQSDLNYNVGSAVIPTATWTLTDSLHSYIRAVDGKKANQFVDDGDNIIEQGEHTFVNVLGSSVTLVDVVKDTDSVITGVTVTDRRGDVFNAEVGNFSIGKYPGELNQKFPSSDIDYRDRYKDIKINGLNNRTTYEFEYMDITYKSGDGERTQRVRFDDSRATGSPGVTGRYLTVATSENRSSEIGGYNTLLNKSNLYQVNVGLDRLTYIVKVDDTSNLERIEVRGLRGGETYEVKNVKSKDGKDAKSSWFAVEITGLEENRNYDFLSLETVYNDNGRERYGNPVSLGRNATSPYSNVLFPVNNGSNVNQFTTTNKENKAEVWIDSKLEYEQIPGGVRFVGRVKDADSILNGVTAYINNNGTYEKIDDANVKMEKTYRVVNGVDKSNSITYPYLNGNEANLNFNALNVESASEMVEITITGIQADRSRDFRFDFTTSEDGYRVNTIRTDSVGAFGSIYANGTKTQQGITRYATGRAGDTKVQVGTSGVQVSGVTTTTANVTADINNPDKEGIIVEVSGSGVSGVTAKYNVDKNLIELSGLKVGTEYKDMKLVLKYGTKSTTLDVPTFKTSGGTNTQVQGGVAGYVARVYRAFFNREPEQQGLLYWTQRLVSGQETLKGFLGQVSFTPEMLEKNLTNTQFVEAMYAIVDRAGESEGVAFWVSEIEKGIKAGETQSQSRSAVVLRMLDTPEVKEMAKKLGIKFE